MAQNISVNSYFTLSLRRGQGEVIQVNTYTPFGQLKQKKISEGNTILQTIDYTYNIRGWLTSINNPSQVSINGDLFAMNLHYNTEADGLNNQPMFSGNISAAEWQTVQTTGHTTPVTTGRKAYVYRYDQLSRLTNASFSDYTSGAWQASNRFNEKISAYDLNGNIKRLERKGSFSNWTTGTIDNLFYYYKGNQLVGVDDQVMSDNGYDFYDNGSYYNVDYPEFTYDANGNITRDANKGIIGISYDQNNLPTAIEFLNDNKLVYLYDVNGNKLRQDVIQSRILQKRTDFIGNFVMIDNEPAWLNFDEGRILLEDNSVAFTENHLHDHLGNTRVVYARIINALVVKQVNSFYPFGMNIKGLTTRSKIADMRHPANEYLYNGKMFQDELGLDWLDYGARYYDPALARFHTIDPQAERYSSMSPYNYVANNPMLFIDPNGEEVWIYYTDNDGNKQQMQYTSGKEYKGGNEFVGASVKYLNQMASTENGGKVLGSLIESENTFNMTNTFAKDKNGNDVKGALAFAGSDEGGGQIHAGELLNENIAEGAKLESTAHEFFHGYQHENGQGGASIFNEVEAMVFSVSVETQYSFDNMSMGGGSSTPLGKDNTSASQTYQNSFQKLTYNTTFPKDAFVSAVKNFKQGAAKNTSGGYNSYPLRRSNQTKSMLSRFYPLIK